MSLVRATIAITITITIPICSERICELWQRYVVTTHQHTENEAYNIIVFSLGKFSLSKYE